METKELLGWQQVSTSCSGCPDFYDPDTDTWIETKECDGSCYEDDKSCLADLIDEWANYHTYTDQTLIRVDGSGMGWRSVSGYKDVTLDKVGEALYLNGEFQIRYELSADYELTAQRWSHDEPMGSAIFTFTKSPLNKCDACGEIDETRGHEGYEYCPVCLEMRIG